MRLRFGVVVAHRDDPAMQPTLKPRDETPPSDVDRAQTMSPVLPKAPPHVSPMTPGHLPAPSPEVKRHAMTLTSPGYLTAHAGNRQPGRKECPRPTKKCRAHTRYLDDLDVCSVGCSQSCFSATCTYTNVERYIVSLDIRFANRIVCKQPAFRSQPRTLRGRRQRLRVLAGSQGASVYNDVAGGF